MLGLALAPSGGEELRIGDGPLTHRERIAKYETMAKRAAAAGDAAREGHALVEVCYHRQFEFFEWNHASCVRATQIAKQTGATDIEAAVLSKQSGFLAWQRQFDAASRSASAALALLGPDTASDSPLAGVARGGAHLILGGTALEVGDLGEALRQLDLGERAAEQVDDEERLEWIELWRGRVAFFAGQFREAGGHYLAGRERAERLGDRYAQSAAFWFLGATAHETGDIAAAHEYYDQGIALASSIGYGVVESIIRINQAILAIEAKDYAEATRHVDGAEHALRGSPLLPTETMNELRGRILAGRGDHVRALVLFDRATKSLLTRPKTSAMLYQARSLVALGRIDDAKRVYGEAIASIEARRGTLPIDERRAYFLDFYSTYYRELLDLEIESGAAVARVFDLAERSRARLLNDRLQGAFGAHTPVSIEAVQAALPDQTAFIEYAVGARSLQAVVITRTSASLVPLATGAAVAEALARANFLAELVSQGEARPTIEGASRALFTDLLGPLWPAVSGIPNLIISPDGDLNKTPFDVLIQEDGRFLVESHAISLIPSATVLVEGLRQGAGELTRVAAFGDPASLREVAQTRGGRGPLPLARREARAVAALFGGRSYVGGEATIAAFTKEAAMGPALLHVAAHMEADEAAPLRNGIRFADASDWAGFLALRDIVELDLSGGVLVLAGCRSGSGRVMAGEGLLSVAAAFLSAKARSVVGALWDLDDAASLDLMTAFYSRASAGEGAAQALRSAKREMLLRGARPRDWSGVVLWGAPDQRLPRVPFVRRHLTTIGLALAALLLVAFAVWRQRTPRLE